MRTTEYAKANGMSHEDIRKAGLAPDQQSARFRRCLSILEAHGKKNTELHKMLKKAGY